MRVSKSIAVSRKLRFLESSRVPGAKFLALIMLLVAILPQRFLLCDAIAQAQRAGQAEQMFYEARYQEVGLGDLEAAIAIYEKIVTEHTDDVATVAKALLRLGISNEKLKRTEEALEIYSELVSVYPNQPEAEQAQQRLEALGAREDGEKTSRVVRLEHKFTGNEMNRYNVRIKISLSTILDESTSQSEEVSADMSFLLETVTDTQAVTIFPRISGCALKLLLNGEEKINTQSWLPLEDLTIPDFGMGRYEGIQVIESEGDLTAGLESYLKKDYGVQISIADIIRTAWVRFPEAELQLGYAWSNSVQRLSPEKLITRYMLSGTRWHKGENCAVIMFSSGQKGSAVPMGDSKVMDYQLTEKGTTYWAHNLGALVECETDFQMAAKVWRNMGSDLGPKMMADSQLKIGFVIERVGPDRRYSSPENALRELIEALNRRDKDRYYACFASDPQQLYQGYPKVQDFLSNCLRLPEDSIFGYTIPSYEVLRSVSWDDMAGSKEEAICLTVRQTIKYDYSDETKVEETEYWFSMHGDKWLSSLLRWFPLRHESLSSIDKCLSFLIQAINKRDLLSWFTCMSSSTRVKLAMMSPEELQDYFNSQWSESPLRMVDYLVVDLLAGREPSTNAIHVALHEGAYSNEREVTSGMKVIMVKEADRWHILSLEKGSIDLAISSGDISLTRDGNGKLLIAANVHNEGNISVFFPTDVRYFLGSPGEDWTFIGEGKFNVMAGSYATRAIPWNVEDGEYEVSVIVDPEDRILETNEDNNQASKTVRVGREE